MRGGHKIQILILPNKWIAPGSVSFMYNMNIGYPSCCLGWEMGRQTFDSLLTALSPKSQGPKSQQLRSTWTEDGNTCTDRDEDGGDGDGHSASGGSTSPALPPGVCMHQVQASQHQLHQEAPTSQLTAAGRLKSHGFGPDLHWLSRTMWFQYFTLASDAPHIVPFVHPDSPDCAECPQSHRYPSTTLYYYLLPR